MQDDAIIVIFPSEFAKPKMNQLINNIKHILKIKELDFQFVKRDSDVIIAHANDPVFASSSIKQLFGIKKIIIARQVQNDFKSIVNEITKLGGNLLLNGDRFFVKIEGKSKGFVVKDAEIAATSSIIENKSDLGAMPGSENKYDKILYSYITKKNAYVSIFEDQGSGGLPNFSQNQKIICPVFDEISGLSCIESIKNGFDVKIIVVYKKKNDLTKIVKILTKIIPYKLQSNIILEFYHLNFKKRALDQYDFQSVVAQLCKIIAENSKISRISLPLSNKIFPLDFVEDITGFFYKTELKPYFPLEGTEDNIRNLAREFNLDKYFNKITIHKNLDFGKVDQDKFRDIASDTLKTRQKISISIGPNNLHDILDAIE